MLRFYEGKPKDYNPRRLCNCYAIDFCDTPTIGDIIALPPNNDDVAFYKIKHRVIVDDCVEYFCELYDWED